MILGDLYDLYELKRESDPHAIPERYWCRKSVSWEIVIDHDGKAISVIPLVGENKKSARMMVVPDIQRTSGVRPFFLCDNAEYLLGADKTRGKQKKEECNALHEAVLSTTVDAGANAIRLFLSRVKDKEELAVLEALIEDPKSFAVFRLVGDEFYVHERQAIKTAWREYKDKSIAEDQEGICLVTGRYGPRAALFPQVTGLPGAQPSGASLVSCNADSFSSYGQRISTAGAISAEAADKSGSALAYVLKDYGHRVRVGNDYIAFWTDAADLKLDENLAFFLDPDELSRGESEEVRGAIQTALIELRKGKSPVEIPEDTNYHLLGIAPYQARLATRFYESGSLSDLKENIVRFLQDTEVTGVSPCSMRSYLEQTAPQGDSKKVPTTLVTSSMRALIHGGVFPTSLYQKILVRTRLDHGENKPWDMGRRAAILKACLIRKARATGSQQGLEMERRLTVGLNYENDNQGYLLGRLFALLEKVQLDAIGGANATIRDRYMGAAGTTPARVYPQLLKLAQHHISKSEYGGLIDRQVQEVIGRLGDSGFPKTLSFDDQGLFYIGYYQQKQALYTRKAKNTPDKSQED